MTKKHLNLWISIFVIMIIGCTAVYAQAPQPRLHKLTQDLYMVDETGGGNMAFLITDEGVVVVDSSTMPATARQVMELIKTKTDKPIKYLIITHYHRDHTQGIGAFADTVKVIGHKNVAVNVEKFNVPKHKETIEDRLPKQIDGMKKHVAELKAKNSKELAAEENRLTETIAYFEELKKVKQLAPTVLFDDKYELTVGGQTILVKYLGPTHTNCSTVVYFPKQKVLHTGDLLFNGMFPFIDFEGGCDTDNWVKQLKATAKWDVEKVIPGHGELTDTDALLKKAQYLTDLRSAVKEAVAKGLDLEQTKESVKLPAYNHYKWPNYLTAGVEAVYNELTKKK